MTLGAIHVTSLMAPAVPSTLLAFPEMADDRMARVIAFLVSTQNWAGSGGSRT
jgi:hypothetical protein